MIIAIIPVKKFESGKTRLSPLLGVQERARLSELMLQDTLAALGAAHSLAEIVVVSSDKLVERLVPPVPLELLEFGLAATLRRLEAAQLRDVPRSPDGGVIADFTGEVVDPEALAARLSSTPGVVEHGLFPAALVSDVIVGRGEQVEHRSYR